MNLLLRHALVVSRKTEEEFFRMCHLWRFGKDQMCNDDVAQYKLHGVVPRYVMDYLKYALK